MKAPAHSFGEKIKEIFIEICIIVFAVTLSIWLHSWSEHRHEQKEVNEFLEGLKTDLSEDIKLLETHKNVITGLNGNYQAILSINKSANAEPYNDSVITRNLVFEIPVTRPSIGRYEGFKSSGKIGTVEDPQLKQNILEYYQQSIAEINYGENYVNSVQLKIIDLSLDRNDKTSLTEFATTPKFKALLRLCMQNFDVNLRAYNEALQKARDIIAGIDKTLHD